MVGIGDSAVIDDPPPVPRVTALKRIDMETHEGLRACRCDVFDVDAALCGEHEERLLRTPIEGEREVVLAFDVRRALDPHLRDGVSSDVHAEDVRGASLRLTSALGELDASGLAAAACEHLCLDDDRESELVCRAAHLLGRCRQPSLRGRDPVSAEELFPLVLVKVQSARESIRPVRPGVGIAVCEHDAT